MRARMMALGLVVMLVPLAPAFADEPGQAGAVDVPGEQPVTAAPPPFVEIRRSSVAAGIGISWGGGKIKFDGRDYGFKISGLSLGELGAAKMMAMGDVQNLQRLSDFEGRYTSVEAGVAAPGKGTSVLTMRNQHGVVIKLRSQVSGVHLKLAAQGLNITLE